MYKRTILFFLIGFLFFINGCAVVFQPGRRTDIEKIQVLEDELGELRNAKGVLEDRLFQEIKDKQVRLKMEKKGLVITFVAEVLFGSGKAELREESYPILDKVVQLLNQEVLAYNIGVEGHTDNEPIKYSRWKSNWELSVQRSLSVVHYLVDKGVGPKRLAAIGYGEFQPVASNLTTEGMQLNRRVEIVVLPKELGESVKNKIDNQPLKDDLPKEKSYKKYEEEELK